MAEGTVDKLSIEVEASAVTAARQLDALAAAAERLSKAIGKSTAARIDRLTASLSALASVQDLTSTINGMNGIADAAQRMGGVKLSESFGNQLPKIAQSLSEMPEGAAQRLQGVATALQGFAGASLRKDTAANVAAVAQALAQNPIPADAGQRLSEVAAAIGALGAVKGPTASIGNQLRNIAAGATALSQVDLPSEKVQKLVDALSHLANIPKNGLSTTVRAMMQLPQAAQALHSVNFEQLAEDCRRLSKALDRLPEKLRNVADGMRALAKANAAANKYGGLAGGGGSHRGGFFGALWNVNKAVLGVRFMANTIAGAVRSLGDFVGVAGNYVEDMNLFTVSMGEYGQQAWEYAQKVNAALGIDVQEWAKGQGVFMSMARGMGVASDNAALISQQLTQLSYDLASFYNIDTQTAMEKVQAGLSGQLRPLRELGYDLSDARLKQDALAWGITKSVDSMTQAEKALLRYREMMEQVSFTHGDMARTVQSPMNQLRILKSVVQQAARAWSAVFLPAVQAVLSILISLARAIAAVGNMVASLTGGSQMMQDALAGIGSGGAFSDIVGGVEDVEDATEGAGSAAGGAADQYEKLKRTILGFDEINALKAVSDQTGGGGSGGGGGGAGGGGGLDGFELPTYDFLGNAEDAYREVTDRILAMFDRIAAKWEPFVAQAQDSWSRIRATFEGVDILGPLEDNIVEINGLLAALGTQGLEAFTQLWEDLGVPRTVEVALNFSAETWRTATSVVNLLGSAINGLLDGLSPLTQWFGEKLRDALSWGALELERWRRWFEDMQEPCGRLAEAVGRVVTAIAQKFTPAIDDAITFARNLQWLLGEGLRKSLEWLIDNAIPFFEGLADYIGTHSLSEIAYDAFVRPFDQMRDKIGLTDDRLSGLKERLDKIPAAVDAIKTAFQVMSDKVTTLVNDIIELLRALGDDLRSFARLDFDFSSTKEALANLVADVTGIDNLDQELEGALRPSLTGIGGRFVSWIGEGVGDARGFLASVIGTTATGSMDDATPGASASFSAGGGKWAESAGDGIEGGGGYVTSKAGALAAAASASMGGAAVLKKGKTSGYQMGTSYGDGILVRKSYVGTKSKAVSSNALYWFNYNGTAKKRGQGMGTYYGDGIYSRYSYVQGKSSSVGSNAAYWLYWPETVKKYGIWTAEGFALGLSMYRAGMKVYNAAQNLAQKVFDGLNAKMYYGSPPKATIKLGRWTTEGLAIGVAAEAPKVYAASELVAQSALDGLDAVRRVDALDVGGTIGTAMDVTTYAQGSFELDWERMEQAVAQGTLEGMVAGGGSRQQSGRAELVLQVDGQALGRVALGAIDRMAANGSVNLDLIGA